MVAPSSWLSWVTPSCITHDLTKIRWVLVQSCEWPLGTSGAVALSLGSTDWRPKMECVYVQYRCIPAFYPGLILWLQLSTVQKSYPVTQILPHRACDCSLPVAVSSVLLALCRLQMLSRKHSQEVSWRTEKNVMLCYMNSMFSIAFNMEETCGQP